MGIEFHKKSARFIDIVDVEAAEVLLDWLQKNPRGKLDLSACTHLHSANLQVIMAVGANISVWPQDTDLRIWLQSAFAPN